MAVVTQIQVRRGTASQWTSANPVLAAGEQGFETDTNKLKIGNGSSAWNSLSYIATGATGTVTSVVAGTGLTGGTITSTGTIAIDTSVTADLSTSQTLTNKTLTAPIINLSINTQTGTTYTPVLSDNGKLVTLNNASAISVTIPTNGSVAYAVGAQINFAWITGAGQPTITAVTPGTTTILSTGATSTGPKIRAVNAVCSALKIATDTWLITGDIS